VTFVSPDGIWALRFGGAQQYAAFTETYNDKLFENTFKVDNDEGNRNKVGRGISQQLRSFTLRVPAAQDNWNVQRTLQRCCDTRLLITCISAIKIRQWIGG